MKKHLFIVSLSLLLLLTTACGHSDSDIPARNGTTTQPSVAESACPDRSFAALTTANGIRVGETLFVPLQTVESFGIHVEVQINQEHEYITGRIVQLPQ